MPTPSPCCTLLSGVAEDEGNGAVELVDGVMDRNLLVTGEAPKDEGGEVFDFRLTRLGEECVKKLTIPPLPLPPNSSSVLKKPVLFFTRNSIMSVKLELELEDVPVPLVSLLGV
ncbi:hypothetical protein BDN71DRAFT_1513734 [Pleurotus eryngii]|uniref:Uncharacterized protein n=1 Tax=Pleurotus eryngii TaxID=5323 RepID=A0A9P5ZG76_PLEER|nr:hypothetical protein BDN71DRAFT_1513734 [Pleurotus eryngii]